MNSKYVLATTLAVLTIGGLSACQRGDIGEQAGYQPGMEEQVSEQPGQVAETEQAVREGAAPDMEQLQGLESGRNVNWYVSEINRMGWEITDINRTGDEFVYELRSNGERADLTLTVPEGEQTVQSIDVQERQQVTQQQMQQDPEVQAVVTRVQQIEAGQTPYDYINSFSQVGRVTEFQWDVGSNDAEIEVAVGEREFEFNLNVDPQTNRVTEIDMHEEVWGI